MKTIIVTCDSCKKEKQFDEAFQSRNYSLGLRDDAGNFTIKSFPFLHSIKDICKECEDKLLNELQENLDKFMTAFAEARIK